MRIGHCFESLSDRVALSHALPERLLVLIIAYKGYRLRIAVNKACACLQKSRAGNAVAGLHHAFADSHPYAAVAEIAVYMILDVASVNTVVAAAKAARPLIRKVFTRDACARCEAEVR